MKTRITGEVGISRLEGIDDGDSHAIWIAVCVPGTGTVVEIEIDALDFMLALTDRAGLSCTVAVDLDRLQAAAAGAVSACIDEKRFEFHFAGGPYLIRLQGSRVTGISRNGGESVMPLPDRGVPDGWTPEFLDALDIAIAAEMAA